MSRTSKLITAIEKDLVDFETETDTKYIKNQCEIWIDKLDDRIVRVKDEEKPPYEAVREKLIDVLKSMKE
jgi:hypothetical protein